MEVRVATEEELRTVQPIPEPRNSLLQSRRPSTAWPGSRDLRARAVQDINTQWQTLTSSISQETGGRKENSQRSADSDAAFSHVRTQQKNGGTEGHSRGSDAGRGSTGNIAFKISNIPSTKVWEKRKLDISSRHSKDDAGNNIGLEFARAGQPAARKNSREESVNLFTRAGLHTPKDRLQDDQDLLVEDCSLKRPSTAGTGLRVRFANQGDCSKNEDPENVEKNEEPYKLKKSGDPQSSGAPSVAWRVRSEYADLSWIKSLVQYAETHPIYIRDGNVNDVFYQPTGQWQHVVFPAACPTRREDVLMLEQWLAGILLNVEQIRFPAAAPAACHVQAASMKGLRQDDKAAGASNGIAMAEAALVVYNTAFCEIVRQVELNCKERSQLLWTVWTHYFHLVNALKIMEFNGQIDALQGEVIKLQAQLKVELSCFGEEEKKLQEKIHASEAALEQEQYSSEFVKRNLASKILTLQKQLDEEKESHSRLQNQISELIQTKISLEREFNKEVSLRHEADRESAEQAAAAKTILLQFQTLQAELHILRHSEKVAVERGEQEAVAVSRLQKELDDKVFMYNKLDTKYACQRSELLQANMKLAKLEAVEEELDRERDWHEQTKNKCHDYQRRCSAVELQHEKLFRECEELERKCQQAEASLLAAENKVTEYENRSRFLEKSVLTIENLYHQEKKKTSELQTGMEAIRRTVEQLHSSLTSDPICQYKISQRICQVGNACNDDAVRPEDSLAIDTMIMTLGEAFECLEEVLASDWDECNLLVRTHKILIASDQHICKLRDMLRSTWRKNSVLERRLEMEIKDRGDLEVQLLEQKTACERLARSLDFERNDATVKDSRWQESLQKKDTELESDRKAIVDLQDRISMLVQEFQHQEERACQAHQESVALLQDHENITEHMTVLQLSLTAEKDAISRLKDEKLELQGQVAVLSQELTSEKEEKECAIQAILDSNRDMLSVKDELMSSKKKVDELEKVNQTLVQDLRNAHQLVCYARAFFKNLIDAKARIECLDPSFGFGDPYHGQIVDMTNFDSAAAQSHIAFIGESGREPPLLLRLKSALLTKTNQKYRIQLCKELKERVQTEEQLVCESRCFEDDLFIQMRCIWSEESSALRRIARQVNLLKAGLADLVQLAGHINKQKLKPETTSHSVWQEALSEHPTEGKVDTQALKLSPTKQDTAPEEQEQSLRKKVKFIDDWEKRLDKLSIRTEWEVDSSSPTYLASTGPKEGKNSDDSSFEEKWIQVPEDLEHLDPETLAQSVTHCLSSNPRSVFSRKKLLKVIVRIYTEGVDELEKAQRLRYVSHETWTPSHDGILIKLQIIFRETHGTEGSRKVLEFLSSCMSCMDDLKVNTFARFCGLVQHCFDNNAFHFKLEVLYCLRQLLGVNWRAVMREWEQGTTAIPETAALCMLGNAYNVAVPTALPVYLRRLQPVLKESMSGMVLDLDTLLVTMCQEYVEQTCPVYPLTCPRRMAPYYKNPTQPSEDKSSRVPPTSALSTPRDLKHWSK